MSKTSPEEVVKSIKLKPSNVLSMFPWSVVSSLVVKSTPNFGAKSLFIVKDNALGSENDGAYP